MQKPFTRVGKQIMASGTHYADAADETAAQFTLDALNTKAFAVTEDLKACCQQLLDDMFEMTEGCTSGNMAAARAAIAKATGAGA